MAKAKKNGKNGGGALENVLAPVASLVVLGAATVEAMRHHDKCEDGVPLEHQPPGQAIEVKKEKERQENPKGLRAKLERIGERIKPLGRALEVQQRYGELRGNNVAASVAFQAFVSLFPLLLVIVGVIGLVARHGDVDVAGKIIGNLGLNGDAATTIQNAVNTAKDTGAVAGPIGIAGLLWSGLAWWPRCSTP